MGRDLPELIAAAAPYVAVRVTNLRSVDIANVRFDFDLTLAIVLMHADGTIYHRYGGRGPSGPERYLSVTSLTRLLRETLPEHREYDRTRSTPKLLAPLPAIDLPVLRRKIAAGQTISCVHCHTVHDAEVRHAMLGGEWQAEAAYVFPDPERIGMTLDPERQSNVIMVKSDSASARAGIRPGDELLALGVQPSVRTFSDVQWALHRAPSTATKLSLSFRRGDSKHHATLSLPDGWKRCPPRDYSWRPLKWNLSPAPGFGGSSLSAAERAKLGLADAPFAMRVTYFIDWGELKTRGRLARASGLKKGDIIIGFAGKRDFDSFDHLHAFCALRLRAGARTAIMVWRDGKPRTLHYELPR